MDVQHSGDEDSDIPTADSYSSASSSQLEDSFENLSVQELRSCSESSDEPTTNVLPVEEQLRISPDEVKQENEILSQSIDSAMQGILNDKDDEIRQLKQIIIDLDSKSEGKFREIKAEPGTSIRRNLAENCMSIGQEKLVEEMLGKIFGHIERRLAMDCSTDSNMQNASKNLAPFVKSFEDRILELKEEADYRVQLITEEKDAQLAKLTVELQRLKNNKTPELELDSLSSSELELLVVKKAEEVDKITIELNSLKEEEKNSLLEKFSEEKDSQIAVLRVELQLKTEEVERLTDDLHHMREAHLNEIVDITSDVEEKREELAYIQQEKQILEKKLAKMKECLKDSRIEVLEDFESGEHPVTVEQLQRVNAHLEMELEKLKEEFKLIERQKDDYSSKLMGEIDLVLEQNDKEREELKKQLKLADARRAHDLGKLMEENKKKIAEKDQELEKLKKELYIVKLQRDEGVRKLLEDINLAATEKCTELELLKQELEFERTQNEKLKALQSRTLVVETSEKVIQLELERSKKERDLEMLRNRLELFQETKSVRKPVSVDNLLTKVYRFALGRRTEVAMEAQEQQIPCSSTIDSSGTEVLETSSDDVRQSALLITSNTSLVDEVSNKTSNLKE